MTDDKRRDEIARRLGGDDWAKQQEFLTNPLIRVLTRALGVDLTDVDQQRREVREGLSTLLQAAIWFAPLGWFVSAQNLKSSDYSGSG